MTTKYNVFHRTWWKKNPAWPNGLEPVARQICEEWNDENEPGELSDKAEFEEA